MGQAPKRIRRPSSRASARTGHLWSEISSVTQEGPKNSPYSIFVIGKLSEEITESCKPDKFLFEYVSPLDHEVLFDQLIARQPELILIPSETMLSDLLPVLARLRFHPQMNDRPVVVLYDQPPELDINLLENLAICFIPGVLPGEEICLNLAVRCRDGRASRWRALREFSGAMAHTLNQPIAALMGSSEIIGHLGTATLPQHVNDALGLIQRNILEVEGIVRKLEALRRYETAAYPGQSGGIIDLDKSIG